MSKLNSAALAISLAFGASVAPGQSVSTTPTPTGNVPGAAELMARVATVGPTPISDEVRRRAYEKLFEGQRYLWAATNARRGRPDTSASNIELARKALNDAIAINPKLAEAYTALAEVNLSGPRSDVDEALALAAIAVRLDGNNFGGRRILARLFTYKSGLAVGKLIPQYSADAVREWTEVTRLDPRNAEAWAFLSALYARMGKSDDEIAALQRWISSAPALDTQFYQRIIGRGENLTPENATVKLGTALLSAGRSVEAILTLTSVISESPENEDAVEILKRAIELADAGAVKSAIAVLKQSVDANPRSLPLASLLARANLRVGNVDEAIGAMSGAASRIEAADRQSAAAAYVELGDILARAGNTRQSAQAYEKALDVRGLAGTSTLSDDEREPAMAVYGKLIQLFKDAERSPDVLRTIENARRLLGADDLFADRQLISYYRETGRRTEALAAIRAVRRRIPNDYGFLRLEATVLTELGRVDEGVALMRKLLVRPAASASTQLPPAGYDEYSNHLFISSLYSQANRGKEAAAAARDAVAAALGSERRQLARITLATAQQLSGDFAEAEKTLRAILADSPGNPIAQNNLGYFLLERNERIPEALELILKAYTVDPTNPSYLDSLGWAYFKSDKLADAERFLREAARSDPSSSTVFEHLGDVLAKAGKSDEARTNWQKALKLASDPADAVRLRKKLGQGR